MSRVFVGLVLVMFAVTMGCNCGGGGSSAESAAKGMLDAAKNKDVDKMFTYIDLQGMYDQMPPEAKKDLPFEKFKEQVIKLAKDEAKTETNKKFDYRNLKVTEKGDTATIKVETTEDGKEWKESTVDLKKIGGKWMLTEEGMKALGE